MSQQNRALAHRWFEEVWNQGREETIHELLAPDAVAHSLSEPGVDARGQGDFLQFFLMMRGAFPDMKLVIEDTIAEGDKVVLQDLFRFQEEGLDKDGRIVGQMRSCGLRPQFEPHLTACGFKLPAELFSNAFVERRTR